MLFELVSVGHSLLKACISLFNYIPVKSMPLLYIDFSQNR